MLPCRRMYYFKSSFNLRAASQPTLLNRARRLSRAFTLLEVMIGFSIFAVGMIGMFAVLMQSYRLAARARYIDESRVVLRTIYDQMMSPAADPEMLKITPKPTGKGLTWNDSKGSDEGLNVTLGQANAMPLVALVTREVTNLDSNGQPTTAEVNGPAGHLIQCKIAIQLVGSSQPLKNAITLVRSVP